MGVDMIEGFDDYQTAGISSTIRDLSGGNGTSAISGSTDTPRGVGRSVRIEPDGGSSRYLSERTGFMLSGTRVASGFNFKYVPRESPGSNVAGLMSFRTAVGQLTFGLYYDESGDISVRVGGSAGTVLATASGAIIPSTWHHIEFQANVVDSIAEGDVVVKVDGVEVISLPAGTDATAVTNSNPVARFQFGVPGGAGQAAYYDDLYLATGVDMLGANAVVPLSPSGAGSLSEWASSTGDANWQNVDETGMGHDGDASYNSAASSGLIDRFVFSGIPSNAVSLHGLLALGSFYTESGFGAVTARVHSAGVDSTVNLASFSAGQYRQLSAYIPNDPATSSAWTVDGLAAAEFGYGSGFSSSAVRATGFTLFALLTIEEGSINADGASGLSVGASSSASRVVSASATSGMSLSGGLHASETYESEATAGFSLSTKTVAPVLGSTAASLSVGASASASRVVSASASSGIGLSETGEEIDPGIEAEATFLLSASASEVSDISADATAVVGLSPSADATVIASPSSSIRRVIQTDVDPRWPFTYAETPDGDILMANGVDPVFRWRWLRGSAERAGIEPPTGKPSLAASGVGTIAGTYYAFVRFVGRDGNVSNFGPVSEPVDAGTSGGVASVVRLLPAPEEGVANTVLDGATRIRVGSEGHGLEVGDRVIFQEIPEDIEGLSGSSPYAVAAKADDTFDVNVDGVAGAYPGGMSWVKGSAKITYTAIPTTDDPKVVKRQVLRSTAGSYRTFYVDAEITDPATTTAESTKSDDDLIASVGVPLFGEGDRPFASRHHVPPSHKRSVAVHLGRAFLSGEVDYTIGHARGAFGSAEVKGVGTRWVESFVGRRFYIDGDPSSYVVKSVDADSQAITLDRGLDRTPALASLYAIRPEPTERRLVYFSEAGLYESWPPWNAFSVQEDGDEITGLMSMGAWLFILCRHHIYRFTYQDSPNDDGAVFPSAHRGCVNARCWAISAGTAFMLDESGVHAFDGGESESISEPIQDVFRPGRGPGLRVNWSADQTLWHAAHDPTNDTIRWFVSMSGHREPRHALCYNYRRGRWWIEEYPFVVTSSTVASLGSRRSMAGTAARSVLWIGGDSHSEIAPEASSVRGTVASSSPLSLTAAAPAFDSSVVGSPVSIVSGKGAGQQRTIVAAPTTTRVKVDRPWLDRPDDTSVFQVGGIDYRFVGHWYRFADDEESRTRNVELMFVPARSTAAEASLRLYYDFDETPHEWGYTDTRYGAAVEEGEASIAVDLSRPNGIATFHDEGHRDVDADGHRFVSVEIAGTQGPERVRFRQLRIHGVE